MVWNTKCGDMWQQYGQGSWHFLGSGSWSPDINKCMILSGCKVYRGLSKAGGGRLGQVVVMVIEASDVYMLDCGCQQRLPLRWQRLAADTFTVVRTRVNEAYDNCKYICSCWGNSW